MTYTHGHHESVLRSHKWRTVDNPAVIRRFDLGQRFTLVTIPFRPFQHLLTLPDQLSCLNSMRRHLVDGG